jgi:hypothetical protein
MILPYMSSADQSRGKEALHRPNGMLCCLRKVPESDFDLRGSELESPSAALHRATFN